MGCEGDTSGSAPCCKTAGTMLGRRRLTGSAKLGGVYHLSLLADRKCSRTCATARKKTSQPLRRQQLAGAFRCSRRELFPVRRVPALYGAGGGGLSGMPPVGCAIFFFLSCSHYPLSWGRLAKNLSSTATEPSRATLRAACSKPTLNPGRSR